MAKQPPEQNFANHVRRHPAFHFFVMPVFLVNLILSVVILVHAPGLASGWGVVMAVALVVLALLVRINSLKVQDRVIRLEERLRLSALLAEPLRSRIPELTEGQLIALRFASDEEAPALVERTLAENLGRADIKKAIRLWRPDHWRV